ncbi:MAG TPA: YcxB family protein [Clostridia bacterium]|nr:YcxB family protein [Clostridia bacterium]
MAEVHEKTFDIKVRLTMLDYFRYYFSLFNLKKSGLVVNIMCAIIVIIYTLSLVSLLYITSSTQVFDWGTVKGITLDLVIMILFSAPFIRTYLIAFKDAKTHKVLDKDIYITITADKFIVSTNDTKLEYSWKKMYKVFDFSHGFALFIDKKDLAFVLPKRYFKNKEQIKFVKEIIAKYKK